MKEFIDTSLPSVSGQETIKEGVVKKEKIHEREQKGERSLDSLTLPSLETISEKEYFAFLEILTHHKERHSLSREEVFSLMEYGMRILEQDPTFEKAVMIESAFQLWGDFKGGQVDKGGVLIESITDKAYRAMVRLYAQYPHAGHELENLFGQRQTIQPEVLINVVADACGDTKTDPYFLNDMIYSLNYIVSFGNGAYDNAIARELDFRNVKNFFRTGRFLEAIQRLGNVSGDYNFSEHVTSKIQKILEDEIERGDGNYLLSLRARKVASELGVEGYAFHSNRDKREYAPINTERLLNPKARKNEDEIRQEGEDLVDFHYIMQSDVRGYIEHEFNVDMEAISDAEKFYFVKFIKQKNQEEMNRVKSFTQKFGDVGLRTFLAIEDSDDMGEMILHIGETFKEEDARKIFEAYARIVEGISQVERVLRTSFEREEDQVSVLEIKESLLKKGAQVMRQFAQENNQEHIERLLADLDKVETETTVFFLTFKNLKRKEERFSLLEIKDLSLEEKESKELSSEEKEAMRAMYERNYADNPRLLAMLLEKFDERTGDDCSAFTILSYKDLIRGFVGFTPMDSGSLRFHSVNVETTLQNFLIGEAMLEQVLRQKAENHILEADCSALDPVPLKYIEIGCVANSFFMYGDNPGLHLVFNKEANKGYWGKGLSSEDVVEQYRANSLPENVSVRRITDTHNIDFSMLSETTIVSRYIKLREDGELYIVVENVS